MKDLEAMSGSGSYLHGLQADAARWRYVRDALCLHKIEENIDRLIEEAKWEGK